MGVFFTVTHNFILKRWQYICDRKCTTPNFIAPDMWPLNLIMYYAIWSVIQRRVYETRVHDIDELRQRLLSNVEQLGAVAD